jgi:hypothetical protein
LRKIVILALVALVLGSTVLIEMYQTVINPPDEYVPEELPPLDVGIRRDYAFYKDGELVGNYSFWIEEFDSYKGQAAYYTRSLTTVTFEEATIRLETSYVFDEDLSPLEYRLNASLADEVQIIVCHFDGWIVDVLREAQDMSMENEVELAVNTVLIDNNMLGHWDLFFKSFDPEPGKRMKFNMFVPQRLETMEVNLVSEIGTKVITINDVEYECQLFGAPELDLFFYIYQGELLELRETTQNVEIIRNL